MEYLLRKGEMLSIRGDSRGMTVRCLGGALWLTQPGDPVDHVLRPGRRFTVGQRGKIVVVACADSTLKVETGGKAVPAMLWGAGEGACPGSPG